jgi:inosine-uridine nucleoside N-ribohydrolase
MSEGDGLMNFPKISEEEMLRRLNHPSDKVRFVLDTDTYNEIDDQFALIYALMSPEKLDFEAVYAAPYFNNRSSGPADGMEKSYEEIMRLLNFMYVKPEGFAYRGSTAYLKDRDKPEESEAVLDLIERAMKQDDRLLYVSAIGAITNIASAIMLEPEIVNRIVVIWLGGQPLHWSSASEFNLMQDIRASRLIFDCGVPLIHIPCSGVTSHLLTTESEMAKYVKGQGKVGDYLYEIFVNYHPDQYAYSKVIWDISAIAWLLNPNWVPTEIVHSPILTDQVTYSFDNKRHFIRNAIFVHRDPIFRNLFDKLKTRNV